MATGAILGGGASIIDQATSGYPINWQQVGVDTLWGIGGGAAGWSLGKAFQWAAKTPLGQAAINWTKQQTNKIPIVRDIAARLGPNGKPGDPDAVDLATPQRRTHILDGDGPNSGGHRWPGQQGKTPFPRDWSDDKIMDVVSDISTDPKSRWIQRTGPAGSLTTRTGTPSKFEIHGQREGIPILVVSKPLGDGIITGYPTQWPQLKATPWELALRNELSLAASAAEDG